MLPEYKTQNKLKGLVKHPYFGFIIAGFLLLFIEIFRGFFGVTVVDAVAKTLVYFIAALGFTLLLGFAGLASLATAAFIGLGTFVAVTVMQAFGLPFFVALIVAIILAIVLGIFFGFVSLRIEGMYLAIVTLGISEILVEVFKNFDRYTGGTSGINLFRFSLFGVTISQDNTYYLLVVATVIVMILTYNLIDSPTGRALLAIKNSDSAAQAMGISLMKYRLLAFVVTSVYAVVAGVLYMTYIRFSNAGSWDISISLFILAAVVVGGAKSIWGVFMGAFVIFGLDLAVFKNIPFFNQARFVNFPMIITGLLIIIVIMYYPGGLIRLVADLKLRFIKGKAKVLAKWRDARHEHQE